MIAVVTSVGAGVGSSVGDDVGVAVGSSVGAAVGEDVGSSVGVWRVKDDTPTCISHLMSSQISY
jgi:hypothetical protein